METTNHRRFRLLRFLVLTIFLIQSATAQTTRPDQTQPTQYATFTPSVAVIIIVLIAALFFLGFFSIYIRHCSDNSAAGGGTVRPLGGRRSRRNAARGLDARLIETLPTFPYSEVKHLKIGKGALECAVCLNEFEDDETLRLLPRCDHVFHPECIDEWLSSHTTCPVCRANLADAAEEATVSDDVTVENEGVAVADRGSVTIEVAEEGVADDGGSVNRSGPFRSKSIKSMIWSNFPRSHSTGHSLVQPEENVDRFTLKLPNQIRQDIMTRALNRTTSLVVLPRETSSRRGYRVAAVGRGGEGSSRGKSYRRLGSLDRPDRWMFTMAPPFLARESSMKKSNRSANGSDGISTSKRFNLIGRLSFNRFGGSKRSEPGLIVMGNKSNNESSLPV